MTLAGAGKASEHGKPIVKKRLAISTWHLPFRNPGLPQRIASMLPCRSALRGTLNCKPERILLHAWKILRRNF